MRFLLALLLSLCIGHALAQDAPSRWVTDGYGKALVLYRGADLQPFHQGPAPSCVGCAVAKALELQTGQPFAADWLYGASRAGKLTPFAGSSCAWAAQTVTNIGCVPMMRMAALGYDLRDYSAERANEWARGPPPELDYVAGAFQSEGYFRIRSWQELRGAIANGHPVVVGSSVGFGLRYGQSRNSRGELRARWWSRWAHAMVFIGIDDEGPNRAALLLNSWGKNWVRGPQRIGDEPAGSFWATDGAVRRMIRHGDTYAILPLRKL